MIQDDIESSVGQLEGLTKVARSLAAKGLILYRCRYDFQGFGSWLIEAGTSHRRLQVVQDGKERCVRYQTARLQNAGGVPEWEERESVPLNAVSNSTELINWVATLIDKYGPP